MDGEKQASYVCIEGWYYCCTRMRVVYISRIHVSDSSRERRPCNFHIDRRHGYVDPVPLFLSAPHHRQVCRFPHPEEVHGLVTPGHYVTLPPHVPRGLDASDRPCL